jgi:hypothetical protein
MYIDRIIEVDATLENGVLGDSKITTDRRHTGPCHWAELTARRM